MNLSYKNYPHISPEERERICLKVELENKLGSKKAKPLSVLAKFVTLIFALIGFGFLAVYFAVNLHLTNASGFVDRQTDGFWKKDQMAAVPISAAGSPDVFFNKENYCALQELKNEYSGTFWRILDMALNNKKDLAQKNLDVAIKNSNLQGRLSGLSCIVPSENITKKDFTNLANIVDNKDLSLFANSSEWYFFKQAVLKDKDVIKKVELETGLKGRVLVAQLMAEQMRLFYSDRAWFEKVISPVKMLASMSQFSWGVLGIKQETAVQIEKNLKDKTSAFYLGPNFENILNFSSTGTDIGEERFKRITDYDNHYYAYLYAALFNKEIIAQWQKSGIDISNRPEILATIYNIGFSHSAPNNNPQMGGSELDINGNKYSFGRLAYEFYYSGELLEEFPQ